MPDHMYHEKGVARNQRSMPWSALALCTGCLSLAAAWFRASDRDLESFFISDTLYLPSLYRDLITEGNCIWEWYLNPAPNFFPDMGLYMMLHGLLGDLRAASYAYPIVQFLLVGVLLRTIALESGLVRKGTGITLGLLLVALVPLAGWWAGDFTITFQVLVNSFHTGALVNTLIGAWLLLRALTCTTRWYHAALAVIVALAAASDKLFWVMFVVPGTIVCVLLTVRSPIRHRALLTALVLVGSTWAGDRAVRALDEAYPMVIATPYAYMDTDRILGSWRQLLEVFRVYLSGKPLSVWISLAPLVMTTSALVVGARTLMAWRRAACRVDTQEIAAFAIRIFVALFFPLVLIAPVLNGSFDGVDSLRYNFSVFLLSPFVIGILLGEWSPHIARIATITMGLLIGLPSLWTCITADHQRLMHFKPENVVAMDHIAQVHGLRYGVGNYWDAKVMTLFSEQGVTVLPVFHDMSMYLHVNREFMYYRSRSGEPVLFNFVVGNDDLPRALVAQALEGTIVTVADHGERVMLTRTWSFDPATRRPKPLGH